MATEITAAEYAKGEVDIRTRMGMMGAIADAGKAWHESAEKNAEKALEIANASIPIEKMFLGNAGTQELVKRYNETLIERAAELDKTNPLADGKTHLEAFLEGVGNATKDIHFEEFKKGNMVNKDGSAVDLLAVKAEIGKAAREHIGMKVPLEEDLINTINAQPEKFEGVTINAKPVDLKTGLLLGKYAVGLMGTVAGKGEDAHVEKNANELTAQEFLESGTVDAGTSLGMAHAIAEAGLRWGKLPAGERTLDMAKTIAKEEVQKEDMFLQDSKELVAAYTNTLIERPGTNLTAFLDDVYKEVKDVDFDKVKKMDMSGLNGKTLSGIKAAIGTSAQKNMGMEGRTVEEDLLHSVAEDAKKPPEEQAYKDVKIHKPQEMGGGLIQMIMMFIGALLGIDMSQMMGGNAQATERQLQENQLSFSLSDKEKLNALTAAATNLKDGRGTQQDLQMVTEFAGIKDAGTPDLKGDKVKAFGGQVLGEVDKIRGGEIDADTMRANINASYQTSVQEPKKETAAAHDNSIVPEIVSALGNVPTFGIVGAGAIWAAEKMDWRAVADYAKSGAMPQQEAAPHMAGGNHGEHLVSNVAPKAQPKQPDVPTRS